MIAFRYQPSKAEIGAGLSTPCMSIFRLFPAIFAAIACSSRLYSKQQAVILCKQDALPVFLDGFSSVSQLLQFLSSIVAEIC